MVGSMQSSGPVALRGRGARDHRCWVYPAADRCADEVVAFLADGWSRGLRLGFAGPGTPNELRARVQTLPGVDELLAGSGLELLPLEALYGTGPVDAGAVIARYEECTVRALAAGFRGFRIAAEVTELLRSEAELDAFVRSELQLDASMTTRPFSAMCAVADDLGADHLVQLAAVHPRSIQAHAPFQVALGEDGALHLRGEIDVSCHGAFGATVVRLDEVLPAGEMVFDLGELRFIDHRGLLVLDQRAARHGQVRLRRAPQVVQRLVELLDVSHLVVESLR